MSLDNPKYEKSVLISSIIGWSVLFIGIITSVTWYTSKTDDNVPNNQQSRDKISAINEAFISAMGPRWPYILLVILLIISVSLVFLYMASRKESLNISMNDKAANTFNIVFIIFTIIFGVFMTILAVKQWLNYQNRQNNGDIPNYTPSVEQEKKNLQIITIIALILIIIIGGGFGIWYTFFKNKNNTI